MVKMHPFNTKQASEMPVMQPFNYVFQFWESGGDMTMLCDVSLTKEKKQSKTAGGRQNRVI